MDAQTQHDEPPKMSDLVGMAPNLTGGACSVCYIRWQRRDDLEHEECRAALDGECKTVTRDDIADALTRIDVRLTNPNGRVSINVTEMADALFAALASRP